ncbi:phosphatidylinositide phosphatase SAC1-B-like [Lingula anatina]|uniref:Phosphatidylinositol-3-phosphatase SAC1 n=1 Tax=Lingula anatina TaxID=7574 RepID=A0A1S3I7N3_LINAN|nr:phosphatidylinositide phosphatase SAC1-B-like [Lingula anatina]|eukprot:XP_013393866.1 phosphatidylinositide phosphatase SAC1-B-like [Lingula anatina]
MKTHLDEQIFNYGRLVLVDLIDQKGKELTLGTALADNVRNVHNDNIRLESFDFHKECSKMRWERLNILMDRIEADRKEMGYFMSLREGTMLSQQMGVFRTNCIDCLDRTNVVQSLIARRTLQDQLIRLNILQEGEKVEDQLSFEKMYKNVWADNADLCAKQYAGTGALKTDFTRTGKRSFLGLLKDGYNSTIRYFKNNFSDGFRQDAMDLFLGNYIVEEDEGVAKLCPLRQERDWKYLALPAIFMVAFSMCVISVLIPDEHATETLMYIVFWGGASLVSLGLIYYYGDEFVDQPKLAQTKTKVE